MIRLSNFIAFLVFSATAIAADWKVADFIAPSDASKPILIPPDFFVSKFGKGKYRLDSPDSQGKGNCIFLFFEQEATQLTIPSQWKQIEDSTLPTGTLIRERILKNPFEATGAGSAAFLRIRVTAKDSNILNSLLQVADSIIHK